jgi:hypothetical protein
MIRASEDERWTATIPAVMVPDPDTEPRRDRR